MAESTPKNVSSLNLKRSIAAQELILAFEAGLATRDEIVAWADGILASEAYEDTVADISLSAQISDGALTMLLEQVAARQGFWEGVRGVLRRMSGKLRGEPERLPQFVRFLENICRRVQWDVPADLHFILAVGDDYDLASDGQFGDLDQVRADLLVHLARV